MARTKKERRREKEEEEEENQSGIGNVGGICEGAKMQSVT